MRKNSITDKIFLKSVFICGALFSLPLNVYPAHAEEDSRPDFSVACPSSEDRAKVWGVPLLKPEQLVGPFAFLNVPYPVRSFDLAANELEKIMVVGKDFSDIPPEWAPYKEQKPGPIEYPPSNIYAFIELIFGGLLGARSDGLQKNLSSFRYVIDEGCGNLTVWRVGLITQNQDTRIKKIIIRRTYDDVNFSQREIPFSVRDFDQQLFTDNPMKLALDSLSHGSFYQLRRILIEAGLTEQGSNEHLTRTSTYFSYKPNYRSKMSHGWHILVRHRGDSIIEITPQAPSTTYP